VAAGDLKVTRRAWPAAPLAALGGAGFAAVFPVGDVWWPVVLAALAGPAAYLVASGQWAAALVRTGTDARGNRAPQTSPEATGHQGGAPWPRVGRWVLYCLGRRGTDATTGDRAGAGPEGTVVEAVVALAVVVVAGVVALRSSPVVLAEGLRDQRRILQVALPAPDDPALLAVPFLYTATAGFLGAAARVRTDGRLLAILPSLALLVVGLAFGGLDGLARATWVPFVWAATALVAVAATHADRSVHWISPHGGTSSAPHGRSRAGSGGAGRPRAAGVVGAVTMAGVVALAAVPVSQLVPSRGDDGRVRLPRSAAHVPQQGQGNPLARVTALQKGSDDLMFTARASAQVERWRVAVLDRYDGESWENRAAYRVAGRHLPDVPHPPPAEPGSVQDVDARVELAGARDEVTGDAPWGRWLPVADRVTELAVDGALFDATGGTAVVDAGRPLPESYELGGEVRQPDAGLLVDDRAAADAEGQAALQVPDDVPEPLRQLARLVRETADGDYARADALMTLLLDRERFRLTVDDPPGGHALGHLELLVAEGLDGDADPAVGSVEQFVATYALVARMVGLPSRVVVGFRGGYDAGTHEVRAHDATAWVEVRFAQVGWVTFDPVPEPDVYVPAPDEPVAPVEDEAGPLAPLPDGGDGSPAGDRTDDDGAVAGGVRAARRWAGRGLLVLVVVGLPVALVAPGVRRWQRRARRRGAATPVARVAGAWQAAVDELRLAGVDVTDTQAVSDLVVLGRARLGPVAEPLVPLGALANRSRFAATGVDEPAAAQAWALADALGAARRRGRPLRQRVREYVGRPAPAPAPAWPGETAGEFHAVPRVSP
jgi:transglutaminase-like putative cysteine protease